MNEISTSNELLPLLQELRSQIAVLSERLERLEQNAPASGPAVAIQQPPAIAAAPGPEPAARPAEEEGISEEIVLVISAAVAAFLGVRARIRQIRLITSPAWAQQGRVSIQASHRLF